jgi:hypothetical protein
MNRTEETLTIPPTTPRRYISGIAALNVGTGDWHSEQVLHRRPARTPRTFLVGEGADFDTIPLLGDTGIYDCAPLLDRMGVPRPSGPVWAADHARAIADLVIVAVAFGDDPSFVALDDWMPRDGDKDRVFDLLGGAMERLASASRDAVRAWLDENREGSGSRRSYRGFSTAR